MDAYYLFVIVGTLVGFCALAYLLLAPIWRFLDREEKVSDQWTKEALARRRREQKNGDGHAASDEASACDGASSSDAPQDRKRRPPPDEPADA